MSLKQLQEKDRKARERADEDRPNGNNVERVGHVSVVDPSTAGYLPDLLAAFPSSVDMEQQTHKAHRPAQSGAKADKKGKGKQQSGFNEKVRHL